MASFKNRPHGDEPLVTQARGWYGEMEEADFGAGTVDVRSVSFAASTVRPRQLREALFSEVARTSALLWPPIGYGFFQGTD